MRKKISVIGEGVEISQELARYAHIADDVRGAEVVVLAADGDLTEIARSAPAAAVVIVGDRVEARCEAAMAETLFPRARIVGVPEPSRVGAVVESIAFERDDVHDVVVMSDGQFGARSVRLGRGGVRELL